MKNLRQSTILKLFVISAIVTVFLSGCTNKLTAKFESDSIGSLPNKTLPGSPSGDAINFVSEIENQLKVITSPSNPAQKALEYKNISPSGDPEGHSSWLGFLAQSTNFASPVTFVWAARRNFNPAGPDLYIDCSDGSGVVAARIKILANGGVVLVENIATDTGINIGTLPNNETHTFMVTVDLPKAVYNTSILKSSGNITNTGHALITANTALFHNPANPAVSFKFDTYTSSQQYIIEEVFINRKN